MKLCLYRYRYKLGLWFFNNCFILTHPDDFIYSTYLDHSPSSFTTLVADENGWQEIAGLVTIFFNWFAVSKFFWKFMKFWQKFIFYWSNCYIYWLSVSIGCKDSITGLIEIYSADSLESETDWHFCTGWNENLARVFRRLFQSASILLPPARGRPSSLP